MASAIAGAMFEARREQKKAVARGQQPARFELKDDYRPATSRTDAGRYRVPWLFDAQANKRRSMLPSLRGETPRHSEAGHEPGRTRRTTAQAIDDEHHRPPRLLSRRIFVAGLRIKAYHPHAPFRNSFRRGKQCATAELLTTLSSSSFPSFPLRSAAGPRCARH